MKVECVFARLETKFLITEEQRQHFLSMAAEHMVPDEYGRSTNCSIYYDTPTKLMARRALEHPPYREKFRLRSYGDAGMDGKVFVELKKKLQGIVYKRRCITEIDRAVGLFEGTTAPETQIEREIAAVVEHYGILEPAVYLAYERDAYYAQGDHDVRVTLDQGIRFRDTDMAFGLGTRGERILEDGLYLMEVKTGQAMPLWLVKFLSAEKLYKTSYSKYSLAYSRVLARVGQAQPIPERTGSIRTQGMLPLDSDTFSAPANLMVAQAS